MIGRRELAMAKDGVRVINCARGGIINEEPCWSLRAASGQRRSWMSLKGTRVKQSFV